MWLEMATMGTPSSYRLARCGIEKGVWRICPSLQSGKDRRNGIQIAREVSAEERKKISTSGFYGFYERQM